MVFIKQQTMELPLPRAFLLSESVLRRDRCRARGFFGLCGAPLGFESIANILSSDLLLD